MTPITDDFMRSMLTTSRAYSLVILKAGPNRQTPGAEQIVWEHARRNFQLREDGLLSIVCPIRDDSEVAGVGIFNAGVEETRALMEEDPGVKAGPSSGDQFSSLTTITEQVKPEKFDNYEVGAKWDPSDRLSLTTAVYRLDRTHTRSTDPNDPTHIVQTGSQRTKGYELGINGQITSAWSIAGGYAYQDAFVTSATAAAREGAVVAQVPHHTLSPWNQYQFHRRVGAALGIVYRSDMFAAIDDTVTLPGYTRIDAAAYFWLTEGLRLQVNVENLLDKRYWANADSNTNLSPGSPRAVRVGLTTRF